MSLDLTDKLKKAKYPHQTIVYKNDHHVLSGP